jgi:phosphoglycolate phosphatase-like HAD superfamily hydrolase
LGKYHLFQITLPFALGMCHLFAVVGDTRLDMEAAAAAGARYRIGVLSGAHGREILEGAPCTHVVESIAAVPPLWGL